MRGYYHVYTKGLEDDVMFRSSEGYVVGMNYVPISLLELDIQMLAFVLMSNHVHFIVYGTYEQASRFIEMYKNLISRYARNKYRVKEMMRRVGTGISLIADSVEELKQKIAYVLNNPVAAGINCFPMTYEWGSGRCYFNVTPLLDAVPLSSLGRRSQIQMFRTYKHLPQDYLVTSARYIDPSCYVDSALVEKLFYKSSSMSYYLGRSPKKTYSLLISDNLLSNVVSEMLDKQYGGLAPEELPRESLAVLVSDMNRRFNSSPKQIARILKIQLSEVVSILKH